MARLIYSARALGDLERLSDFLLDNEPAAAVETIGLITQAIDILVDHPFIGRSLTQDVRELVISRGHSGYVALYRVEQSADVAAVLTIRHQREAGYAVENDAGGK